MNSKRVFRLVVMVICFCLGVGAVAAQSGTEVARPTAELVARSQSFTVTAGGITLASPVETIGDQTLGRAASAALSPAPRAAEATGSQPWVTLMCKFADFADEPHDLAWYQGMYSSSYPGLDHYFREASYDQFNLTGSAAYGWFTLAEPRANYTRSDGTLEGFEALLDCLDAADSTVDFSTVTAVQVMLNTDLGDQLEGGRFLSTIDGVRVWRLYGALPLAPSEDIGRVANLMSLAMHMHPSFGDINFYIQYDIWNGAGAPILNCSPPHPVYGCTIAQADMSNREHMGWLDPARKYVAATTGSHTITLERATQPGPSNYLMAEIPLFISRDYSRLVIEARQKVGYDSHLPGNAVIIHQAPDLTDYLPGLAAPHLVEVGSGPWSHSWGMWTVGETYVDADNGFEVRVDSATASGFVVTLTRHPRGQIIVQLNHPAPQVTFQTDFMGSFNLTSGLERRSSALIPGNYSVAATNWPAGWAIDGVTCSDGSNPANINLADGEKVVCVFNFRQLPSDIRIRKETTPDGDPQTFQFTSSQLGDFQLSDGGQRYFANLAPGVYDFSEVNLPAGWELTSATCDDGSPVTAVNVSYDEVITCTFRNTGPPAAGQIELWFNTIPNSSPTLFTFDPSYGPNFQLRDGELHQSGPLAPGVYSIAEANVPPGWQVYQVICNDGSTSLAALSVIDDQTLSCWVDYTFNDPYEPNGVVAQATPINYGQTRTGATISPVGDVDYFTFTGNAGDDIVATVEAIVNGSSLKTVLFLYASNGTTLLAGDFDDSGMDPQISIELPSTGIYYLKVQAYYAWDGDPTRFYALKLEGLGTPPPTAAFIASPLAGPAPLMVNFTDQSTGGPTGWSWNFGDGGTSTQRHPSHTYTAAGTYTVSLTATNADGSDVETRTNYITVTAPPPSPSLYVAPATAGSAGGVAATPQDILYRDGTAGTWAMHFDGSDVGVTKAIAAFARLSNGDLLLVLKANQSLPGVGAVTPWDVVRFTPTSTGNTTTGTFAWYVDGSDVGLTTSAEKIDALDVLPDGRVLISTAGALAVPKPGGGTLKSQDEDLTALTLTSVGATTAGTWALYFDGTAVPGLGAEDVAGAHVAGPGGDLYLSITGAFNVGGVSGNGKDVLKLTPSGGGYTVTRFWRGPDNGFNLNINGMELP